jgi:hypothetical protein
MTLRGGSLARVVFMIGCLAGGLCPSAASASLHLRCKLSQGGTVQVLDFMQVKDPYSVKAVDIGRHFRFKAVVIGDERKIDYIKLYTYYQSKRQAVLLHEANYLNPKLDASPDLAALTGTNYLYSPELGRELQYGCALIEVAP